MAADEIYFRPKLPLGSQHGIGIKFAEEKIQPGQIATLALEAFIAASTAARTCLRVGVFGVAEQFE